MEDKLSHISSLKYVHDELRIKFAMKELEKLLEDDKIDNFSKIIVNTYLINLLDKLHEIDMYSKIKFHLNNKQWRAVTAEDLFK